MGKTIKIKMLPAKKAATPANGKSPLVLKDRDSKNSSEKIKMEKIKIEKPKPKVKREKSTTTKPAGSDSKPKLVTGTKKHTIGLKSGKITVQIAGGYGSAKDGIKHNVSKLNDAKCFSKEEVSGMRIESPIKIADPSKASEILPGMVFNATKLLTSGKFTYEKVKVRKPVNLRIPASNIIKNTNASAVPEAGKDITGKLGEATRKLISSGNFNSNAQPNEASEVMALSTTLEDYLKLNIATSGFFMGISGENNFSFSSSTKGYHHLFTFEQKCVNVIADQAEGPKALFTDDGGWDTDWFYIKEVQYGRRLHIVVNSQKRLETYMGQHKGELNWGVVGGKFSVEEKTSSLFKETSIEVKAQGGAPFTETDPKKIAAAIDNYFKVPYSKYQVVPISFTITRLSGSDASLITEAFLDGKNCLNANKVRVKIKEINVKIDDDGADDRSEQLFGQLNVYLYNDAKKLVLLDGKTSLPKIKNVEIPSGIISYGKEDAPLRVKRGRPLTEDSSALKNKYVDLSIQNLDYEIKLVPVMKEEDDFTDDVFNNQSGNYKKSIRTMLLEGSNVKTFLFTDGKSEVEFTIEITPV